MMVSAATTVLAAIEIPMTTTVSVAMESVVGCDVPPRNSAAAVVWSRAIKATISTTATVPGIYGKFRRCFRGLKSPSAETRKAEVPASLQPTDHA